MYLSETGFDTADEDCGNPGINQIIAAQFGKEANDEGTTFDLKYVHINNTHYQ